MQKLTIIIALLGVTGCSAINDWRANQIYTSGYLKALPEKAPPPLYCYETLGKPMCYPEPLPGAEDRLIDYYAGPPPCPQSQVLRPPHPHGQPKPEGLPYPGPRYPDSPIVIRPLKSN